MKPPQPTRRPWSAWKRVMTPESFAQDADVEFCVLGLDLHDEARGVEAEGAAAGQDVDAAVDAGLGDAGAVALGLQQGGDELGHAVALEALGDAVVDHGVGAVGTWWRLGDAGRRAGRGLAFKQGAHPLFPRRSGRCGRRSCRRRRRTACPGSSDLRGTCASQSTGLVWTGPPGRSLR